MIGRMRLGPLRNSTNADSTVLLAHNVELEDVPESISTVSRSIFVVVLSMCADVSSLS